MSGTFHVLGQFAFNFQVPTPDPTALVDLDWQQSGVRVTSPDPGGITWAVTLASWRLQGKPDATAAGVKRLLARVTYSGSGVGGSGNEVALVDYPFGGLTFVVHASELVVDILGTQAAIVSDIAPIVAGWVTRASALSQPSAWVTLTEPVVTSTGTYVVKVPPRARAFRVLTLTTEDIHVDVSQLSGNASPVTESIENTQFSSGSAQYEAANRAAWYPLMPHTTTLTVSTAVNNATRVQWLLGLG